MSTPTYWASGTNQAPTVLGLPSLPLTRPKPSAPTTVVPAYFHPLESPNAWAQLAECASLVRFVVVNPASGPGTPADMVSYQPVLTSLQAAHVPLVGYVDTAYGARSVYQVAYEAQLYQERYGISDIFFDQACSALSDLTVYQDYVAAVRQLGAQLVVLNPGVMPHPSYLDLADITVTFEGPWSTYLQAPTTVPEGFTQKICHLVYDAPAGTDHASPAGSFCFTSGSGAHPWDRLPHALITGLPSHQPSHQPDHQPSQQAGT